MLLQRRKYMVIWKYFDIIDESKRYQDRPLFKYRLSILLEIYCKLQKTEKSGL